MAVTEQLGHIKRSTFKWQNFATCLLLSFGFFIFGYFDGIISTTLTKPSFLMYMDLIDADGNATPNSAGLTGGTTGTFQAGGFLGLFFSSWVMDKYGRKFAMIYLCILGIVSQGILAASQNVGMFIALRFFTGWCSTYCSELAPANLRGLYVGLCGIWCAVGFAIATYFGIAFYFVEDVIQWRVPLSLGVLFPLIELISIYWVPESPRYLLLNGRPEEGLATMIQQHINDGDNQDLVRVEFYQMQQQAELDKKFDSSWIFLFKKRTYRKRAIIIILMVFIGQSSGNLVIQNYGGQLYASLGYNTYNQLILQCGFITGAVVFSIFGGLLVDRIGRRALLLSGLTGCLVSLVVETAIVALYAGDGTNKAALRTGVAAFYCYEAFYSLSIDICNFVIATELFPNHLRAKGTTLATASSAITNLIFLQAASAGFQDIGWKFYLVFIVITTLGIVYLYIMIPETKGIPLEELADVFGGTSSEVAIHTKDIQIDHTNHKILDKSGNAVHGALDTTVLGEKRESREEHATVEEV